VLRNDDGSSEQFTRRQLCEGILTLGDVEELDVISKCALVGERTE